MLGRVGTHMFLNIFFFWKNIILYFFERHVAFQNAFNYTFSRNSENILCFTSKRSFPGYAKNSFICLA